MQKLIDDRKEYAKFVARAWADDDFRQRLMSDPVAVFKENGYDVPEGKTIRVVENDPDVIFFGMPKKPADFSGGSVEELQERIQAGSCWVCCD